MKTTNTQLEIIKIIGKKISDGDSMTAKQIADVEARLTKEINNIKNTPESEFAIAGKIARNILADVKGETGLQGERGEQGIQGEPGLNGKDGVNGKDGRDGLDGCDGLDGVDGKDGHDGKDGRDGINGKDAVIDDKKFKEVLDPVLKDFHARAGRIIEGMPRGSNYGGFIETPLKAGSNITITKDGSGANVISSTASGGGFTKLPPTETVDGVRTVFTFSTATSQPSFLVKDNAMMQATSSAGTQNWTWNNGTKQATFTTPPQDDCVGIQ